MVDHDMNLLWAGGPVLDAGEVAFRVGRTIEAVEGLLGDPVVWKEQGGALTVDVSGDLVDVVAGWDRDDRASVFKGGLSASRPGLEHDPQARGLRATMHVSVDPTNEWVPNSVSVDLIDLPGVVVEQVEEFVVFLASVWGADEGVWHSPQNTRIRKELGLPFGAPLPGWVTWVREGVVDPFVGGRSVGGGVLHRFAESPEGVTREVVAARLGGGAGA